MQKGPWGRRDPSTPSQATELGRGVLHYYESTELGRGVLRHHESISAVFGCSIEAIGGKKGKHSLSCSPHIQRRGDLPSPYVRLSGDDTPTPIQAGDVPAVIEDGPLEVPG